MDQTREIDLRQLGAALVRKFWLIILCTALVGAAMYAYTANFVQPQYQASVSIYVNNTVQNQGASGITASNLATSQRLVTTYVNILKSDTVLDKVAQEVGGNLSAGQIRGMMTAQSLDDTEVFKVIISNSNPELAAKIANAVATVGPAEISYFVDGSSTKIIDYAKVPSVPSSPNISKNTLLGACAGALIAVVIVILQVMLDVRIKDEADLERISPAPVLGIIPSFTQEAKNDYGYESETEGKAVSK